MYDGFFLCACPLNARAYGFLFVRPSVCLCHFSRRAVDNSKKFEIIRYIVRVFIEVVRTTDNYHNVAKNIFLVVRGN